MYSRGAQPRSCVRSAQLCPGLALCPFSLKRSNPWEKNVLGAQQGVITQGALKPRASSPSGGVSGTRR